MALVFRLDTLFDLWCFWLVQGAKSSRPSDLTRSIPAPILSRSIDRLSIRSRRLAARLAFPLWRRAPGRDAVDPLLASLLRDQCQPQLGANHPGKETAHRVRLPAGRLRDGRDGG